MTRLERLYGAAVSLFAVIVVVIFALRMIEARG